MEITELEKSLEKLQWTIDKIEKQLIYDRDEIELIKHKLDSLQSLLEGIESRQSRTETKISDEVAEGVSNGVQELKDGIAKLTADKVVVVNKHEPLWYKLFGRRGR